MNDETRKHADNENKAEAEKARQDGFETAAAAAESALGAEAAAHEVDDPDAPADNAEALAVLVEGLKEQNADLNDKYVRLVAEMENLRRRTARDVKDARAYSIANFARDMLAVSDNLRRALDAIPGERRDAGDAGFDALVEGVEMTERAMLGALERHGVTKLSPEGQKFDPNFHQAMFEVPNAEVPNNTVVQVVQDGYAIGERVLRPAMVGVSKGGPKQAPAPESNAPETNAPETDQPDAPDAGAEPGAPNAQAEKDA